MRSSPISRKEFLTATAVASGTSLLAGCDFFSTKAQQEGQEATGKKGREAPLLAQRVKRGDLPPVDQRLPKKPLVVKPFDRMGGYGGTWYTVEASTDTSWWWMTIVNDHLVKWDPDWKTFVPNVAESFEIIDDGREYVFQLREGMKWSDGEPFTADDLVFWYEAILLNKKLTPDISTEISVDGKPPVVEKLDDYKVKFTFTKPFGIFLHSITQHYPTFYLLPQHYLKQFHPDYNPDVEELVKENEVPDWVELFYQKMDNLNNPDLPVITGWVPKNAYSSGSRQEWERNPYYYKVDPEGSQLPYIDTVIFTLYKDPEPLLLEAANGNVDLYTRTEVTTPQNKPVLARSATSGGYKLYDVTNSNHNMMGICLNLTHPDPDKREMYQNKDFRIGLSYAIDRQEIIDAVFQRQGEPWQTAPRPESPLYDEEMAKQYTEFDLDLAVKHLERAGFTEVNAEGRRLDKQGRPIAITVMTQTRYPIMVSVLELMTATWRKAGIELVINNVHEALFGTRLEANKYDCALDVGELGHKGMVSDPRWFFPTAGSSYARLWSNWYEGITPQEEPPEVVKRQADIYRNEVVAKGDLTDQLDGMRKVGDIAKEEFWTMGISLPVGYFLVVTDRMQNVDTDMWIAFQCPYPAVTNPSQYFIEEG